MGTANKEYLLTIAIPTYNRKDLLKRALDSIAPQLNPKVEVLVSDNASDDGTDEMIAGSFPMVRYIRNETNMGWDYNFLRCYREARGEYIMLLGSDDRIAGGVDYLTGFLEKNDCDLVFLNYRSFDVTRKEIYSENGEWIKDYADKRDIITSDRSIFMIYADHAITFISASVVKNSLISKVKDPERFIGTNFIHTYIMLEAVKERRALFGVIMHPLVEQNFTKGDDELSKTPEMYFTVWGKDMYTALCIHAVECGFQERQMRQVYIHRLNDNAMWKVLLSDKRRNDRTKLERFWQDGYPVVKHFPREWIRVMVVILTPRWVIRAVHKIYMALKKSA